jgi:hypothetical protein
MTFGSDSFVDSIQTFILTPMQDNLCYIALKPESSQPYTLLAR